VNISVALDGQLDWTRALGEWAERRNDILGIALVGSYARGTQRPDSDVDLILVVNDRAPYSSSNAWLRDVGDAAPELSVIESLEDEDWGLVQSKRVRYASGLEVEWGIAEPTWCSTSPVDFGTAVVVAGGIRVLYDQQDALVGLVHAAPSVFEIRDAHRCPALARSLFLEYQAALGVDLSFQSFEAELAGLPGDYVPPLGALIVGAAGARVAGCAALHPWERDIAEMKRLYVHDDFRKMGIGRALAIEVISRAKHAGYGRLRLDTLPMMREAQVLYATLGFREIEPYRENPVTGSTFMELIL
jgi:GNAT superfamily N-acetyltransferase/predicted nucleotidyltransferase